MSRSGGKDHSRCFSFLSGLPLCKSFTDDYGSHEADQLHCLQVNLSRWDLFHAHAFRSWRDGKLGLLFHAKEYPQACEDFPYNLGFCQRSSSLKYDTRGMDFRNLLYYEVCHVGSLPCLRREAACHLEA